MGDSKLKLAGDLLSIDADEDDADGDLLLRDNASRDYMIWVASAQLKFGKVTLGADYMHNSEDYDENDPDDFVSADTEDEVDGYVLSGKWGGLSNKGDWLAGYYYARVEALAVNSSYAQDDWVR